MAIKRFRLKFMFWLDMTKSDELRLAEEIENLKDRRLFSQTIRDGIRLIADLRAGRTSVLLELFPWIASEFAAQHQSQHDTALRQDIDRLRELILSQGSTPSGALARISPAMPSALVSDELDDAPLTVTVAQDNASARNFLSSLMGLQQ